VDYVTFSGRGLHSGLRCSVRLRRAVGPFRLQAGSEHATREELRVVRTDRGVTVEAERTALRVDLVEHLFSALAGLGIQDDLAVEVTGPEVPLLDGAALELALALRGLALPRRPPRLRIVRAGKLDVDGSAYEFLPGDSVEVQVDVEFSPLPCQRASWNGSPESYVTQIAPARTFGFERDRALLLSAGRARFVDPNVVLVLDDGGAPVAPCAPLGPNELARHKLLDLLGDLYVYGGPLLGTLRAFRPGHRANHQVLATALRAGLVTSRR
jgi:UDP-3-O-[3-hydroxymyristoyl] N-acetylglucosamine deacetylase